MEWKHPPKQNGVRAAKNLSLDITDLWITFLICVENPVVHLMAVPGLDALRPSSPHPTDITSQICPIHSQLPLLLSYSRKCPLFPILFSQLSNWSFGYLRCPIGHPSLWQGNHPRLTVSLPFLKLCRGGSSLSPRTCAQHTETW